MMIEVCAGMLDQDNAEQCVIRETEEETGYRLTSQDYGICVSGRRNLKFYLCGEYDESMRRGGGVAHEGNIDVMEMSCFAYAMTSGEIKDAKTISYCMLKLISFKTIFFYLEI
jgi:hypothetical protein